MSGFKVSSADIKQAHLVLSRFLVPSPLVYNAWLSSLYRCEVYLKLENMQPIGSFKIRGTTYKLSQLNAAEKRRGVIAASAGNHAQGVAWASRLYGTKALIVMPTSAPLVKIQNTKALGAEIELVGDGYEEAYQAARAMERKTKRVFVHAYDDPEVIAGQGTAGLEILQQLPDVGAVIASMGGGGLMAGIAIAIRSVSQGVRLIGAQASGAQALVTSIRRRRVIEGLPARTFADGIATSRPSQNIVRILTQSLNRVVTVDDEEIASAVLTLAEKAKVISEGAGAVPLAALDRLHSSLKGKKVVLVVSGGNIDVNLLGRIIDRGLIRAGRRLRVNVVISDRIGSLSRLTALLAGEGANVIQAIHDRSAPSTRIDQTDVELTLETKGPQHSALVIAALKSHVMRLELAN